MVKNYLKIAIVGALFLSPSFANATLMIQTGLVGGSGDVQNVQFNGFANPPGVTVSGDLNQTSEQVDFMGNEALKTPANGQARIEAVDGGFTSIMFQFNPLQSFTKVQFNINASENGTATITLESPMGGTFQNTFNISKNGNNKFTGLASNNMFIEKVSISTNVDITDLKQVRLGGGAITTTATPEPGTVFLLGSGLAGLGLWRWKTKK